MRHTDRLSSGRCLASIRHISYLSNVTSLAYLRQRDVDGALGVVAEAAAGDGPEPFTVEVIRRLLSLIPADRAGYFEYGTNESDRDEPHVWEGDRPPRYAVEEPEYDFCWDDLCYATLATWPLHDLRRHQTTAATKLSDWLSAAELRRNAWYVSVMRPRSVEHEMKLWLAAPPDRVRGFFFVRGTHDRDFDERDLAVLDLLRPHLGCLRERWERRRYPPTLTAREAEVMQLVAEGFTNREIACRLVISSATVRTHLENIFEKLGVHTRTAAVAHMLGSAPERLREPED